MSGYRTYFADAGGGGSSVPLILRTGKVFTVSADSQVLFTEEIDMETDAEIDFEAESILVEVN